MNGKKLKEWYFKLHAVYSKRKVKKHYRNAMKKSVTNNIMSKEQKNKVRNFYKPYRNITMDFHEFYYQKTGKFYENYLPDDLYYCDIDMYFNDWNAGAIIDNKCFYNRMFPNVKQPECIGYRMNGFWYDENMKMITEDEITKKVKQESKVFVKAAVDSAGGKGVFCLEEKEYDIQKKFLETIKTLKCDLIIQRAIQQHEVLNSLSSSSVNTIRILSLLTEKGAKIYSCILRMGTNNSKVDNASSGGITCGINEDGTLKDVAYSVSGQKFDKHPTSKVEFKKIQIPKFNEMCEMVIKNHPLIPHFRLASWDIALDKDENIILIEVNLKYGELDFHQLNNGPLFGEDTKKILNEVFEKH